MKCVRCVCVWLGVALVDERIGFGLYQSCENKGDVCLCLGCGGVVCVVCGEWVGGLNHGLEGSGGVMLV